MPKLASPEDTPPTGWSTEYHVQRWKRGDKGAFEVLIVHFQPLLMIRVDRSRLMNPLRARHQVEDIVQTIWTRLTTDGPKSFTSQGPGSFLAYLGAITDHVLIDLGRRDGAIKRGDGAQHEDIEVVRHPVAQGTPTSAARVSEARSLIEGVLPERERVVWDLVERQSYTYAEAGLAMDCSDAAARGCFHRARQRLLDHFKRDEPGAEDPDED